MTSWNPKDDLFLMNALQAGASLQALAKGAVQFSRRYSYQELQDRWRSLLYDPAVAKLASIGMSELELSGTCPTTKSIKSEYYKEHQDLPRMKKRRSIRKQYYDMRKKSRTEFFSSTDLLFFNVPTLLENHNHGSNLREHHNDIFIPYHLDLKEEDYDILRKVFPETIAGYASSPDFTEKTNGYPGECTISIGNNCQNGITRNESPLDFSNSVKGDERDSPTEAAKCFDTSRGLRNSVPGLGKCAAVKGPGLVQVLLGKRLPINSEEKQLSTSESSHDNSRSTSGFRGSQNVTSPSSEGNSFLEVIGFPSPQPDFPLWNNMEECLAPTVPVCSRDQDGTHVAATMHPDDLTSKGESVSEFNIVNSVPFVVVEESHIPDSDYVDISESLLNLINEDAMTFMGANQQDAKDKTLVDYAPPSIHQEGKVECEPATPMVEEPRTNISNCIPPTMFETVASCPQNEQTTVCHLDNNALSAVIDENAATISGTSFEIREPDCSVLCCTLNTEDCEIPCNDDIFLLIHPSSAFSSSPPFSGDTLGMTSSTSANARLANLSRKEDDSLGSLQWQQNLRSSCSHDMHLGNPYLDCVVESKSSGHGMPPVNARKASATSGHYRSSNGFTDRHPGDNFSRDRVKGTLASLEGMPFGVEGGLPEEKVPQQAINSPASDPEDSQSDDDDVPCTSDVETMILEMDLDPPEEENSISNSISGRVRYLSEETKRTVMRLEQCTQSVLRRTLTSQGAFALLYGRRLEHYIRKTMVVIGRSTDDVHVDIDLSKERRARKLSRRQAIIKMEADGLFYLKNIGKSDISVNGKDAVSGQTLILNSGCLIEIAQMSFVFEISKRCVRQYMNTTARKVTEHGKLIGHQRKSYEQHFPLYINNKRKETSVAK